MAQASTKRLTRRVLETLESPLTRTTIYDSEVRGFGIRLYPGGRRSWVFEYRPAGAGRDAPKRRMKLGDPATMVPEVARKLAHEHHVMVAQGRDPMAERADAAAKAAAERSALTVAEACSAFVSERVADRTWKDSTRRLNESYIRAHVIPALGRKRLRDVGEDDVFKLHVKIAAKHPATANRVRTLLLALFTWAVKRRLFDKTLDNPAKGVTKGKERLKSYYLTPVEIGRLREALRVGRTEGIPWPEPEHISKHRPKQARTKISDQVEAVILLLLLTGARLREIMHVRWDELDLKRGFINLDDSKTGQGAIYLTPQAVTIFESLPRHGEIYVFAQVQDDKSKPEKPLNSIQNAWRAICREAKLPNVRIHDLRHSFAAMAASNGVPLSVIAKQLRHTSTRMSERYSHLYEDFIRQESTRIGGSMANALKLDHPVDNVVPMRRV